MGKIKHIFTILAILLVISLFWMSFKDNKVEVEKTITGEVISDLNEGIVIENSNDILSNISELHWGHMPITYKIIEGGNERQRNLIRKAFETISKESDYLIKFEEVENNRDISIYFKNPTTFDSSGYQTLANSLPKFDFENEKLITSAEINIYGQGMECKTGYPALEVHEILHAFGLDDSPIMGIIMSRYSSYGTSDCEIEKIDKNYASCLKYIYSNEKFEGDCSNIPFININTTEYGCPEGSYEIIGTEFCCPESNMIIVNGYCKYSSEPENEIEYSCVEVNKEITKEQMFDEEKPLSVSLMKVCNVNFENDKRIKKRIRVYWKIENKGNEIVGVYPYQMTKVIVNSKQYPSTYIAYDEISADDFSVGETISMDGDLGIGKIAIGGVNIEGIPLDTKNINISLSIPYYEDFIFNNIKI